MPPETFEMAAGGFSCMAGPRSGMGVARRGAKLTALSDIVNITRAKDAARTRLALNRLKKAA
jgi:hypothetical protein